MKIKREFFAISVLLLAVSTWAGKWTIDSFDDSPDPGEPDGYVAAESSGGLKPVQASQVTPQAGRLYVRQKFEDTFGEDEATYQIFQGKATASAAELGRIPTEGMPYTTMLKMKLFYKPSSATGDDDMENVYFDGKDILVEGDDPVYMNTNGKWEELRPLISKEVKVSITSDPSGATVSIGSTEKGKTPFTLTVNADKAVTVTIAKEGYFTVVKPIAPSGKQAEEGILLTVKKPLDNPATVYKNKLQTAITAKDAGVVKTIKTDIQKTLSTYSTDAKKSIEGIMAKFPANPPKVASESSSDYFARQTLWTNTQAKEKAALDKEAVNIQNELKELLTEVEAAAGEMDFTLKYEYIPTDAITISKMGVKDFTINAEVKNSRVNFQYNNAKLDFGKVSKNDIIENEENVHGVLKIWDKPNENGKYASIYDIAFFYEESPLKVLSKGVFTLDESNAASRNTEKDLNGRIAKYPGKAAWDKKDEVATLDALRRGEVSDSKVAAKSPPKEEAYYDEDEDEDEFDEQADEQERYDYSRYSATGNARDIFGNSDEILFWAGVAFAAAAVSTGVVGFLKNSVYLDADKKIKAANELKGKYESDISIKCNDDDACIQEAISRSNTNPQDWIDKGGAPELNPYGGLWNIEENIKENKKVKDSYNSSRIIWFSAAGVSAAISIVLLAW